MTVSLMFFVLLWWVVGCIALSPSFRTKDDPLTIPSNSTSITIDSPIFTGGEGTDTTVYDVGLVESAREFHVAGASGILIVNMDTLVTIQILNASTLLRLAGADKVQPDYTAFRFDSATFLRNSGRPQWVISIRVQGIYIPYIGVYAFDAETWALKAAHCPLNGVWLPATASDTSIVFDGTGDNTFGPNWVYKVLYNASTGSFQGYPTPTTSVVDSIGPSSTDPKLHYGSWNIDDKTGLVGFNSLKVKACTSINPWPQECTMNAVKLDMRAACGVSPQSAAKNWDVLFAGRFGLSLFGMVVSYTANTASYTCLAGIDPIGYSISWAKSYNIPYPSKPVYSYTFIASPEYRTLASVFSFYPNSQSTNPRPGRVDAWFTDTPQHVYFNVTGVQYLGNSFGTTVSSDATHWFLANPDPSGESSVQLVRTVVSLPTDSNNKANSIPIDQKLTFRSPSQKRPSSSFESPSSALNSKSSSSGACSTTSPKKMLPLSGKQFQGITKMQPGVTYTGNISVYARAQFSLDLSFDLSSVMVYIQGTNNFSLPQADLDMMGVKTSANAKTPNQPVSVIVPYVPKMTVGINVTSPYNSQGWAVYAICADFVSVESVMEGKGTITPWAGAGTPIAALRTSAGPVMVTLFDHYNSTTGDTVTVTGYLLVPVGTPSSVWWRQQFQTAQTGVLYNSTTLIVLSPKGTLQALDFATGKYTSPPVYPGLNVSGPMTIGFSKERVVIFAQGIAQMRATSPGFPLLYTFPANFSVDYCQHSISNVAIDDLGYCYFLVQCYGANALYIYGPNGKQVYLVRYGSSAERRKPIITNKMGLGVNFMSFKNIACIKGDCYRGTERYRVGGVLTNSPLFGKGAGEEPIFLNADEFGTVHALRADVLDALNPVWSYGPPYGDVGWWSAVALSGSEVWSYDKIGSTLLAVNTTNGRVSRMLTWPSSDQGSLYFSWEYSLSDTHGVYFWLGTPFDTYLFYLQ